MKTLEITEAMANDILFTTENDTYILWMDGSGITKTELIGFFEIEIVFSEIEKTDYQVNLVHIDHDFRIDNIVLTDLYF